MKKVNNKYETYTYIVSNREGFTLTEALRLWKAKYPEFIDFEKDVITHERMKDFGIFVKEMWDDVLPVTVKEALATDNTEIRRIYFDCIGVAKLFKELEPKLRDRQVIKKKRHKWDEDNKEDLYEFEDVYELYEIEGTKLYNKDSFGREPNPVYAVRCWCTTTNREYWIYVNQEAATGERWWYAGSAESYKYDAIKAIAWTIRIDVTNPEKIYRQGDIIVAKLSSDSEKTNPYHIDKKQYLELMYSET